MACEKRFYFGWIGLARSRVGLRCEQLLPKGLGSADRKDRQVDHCGSPHFAIGLGKLQPKTAYGIRLVGDIRLPAPEGEPADHRHAPRLEDARFRQTDALPITFKEPGGAQALG